MTVTQHALIRLASEDIGDVISGTLAGSGMDTNTFRDNSDDSPLSAGDDDDRIAKCWLYVHTGTHAGVQRVISTYTKATQQGDVYDLVTGPYDSTDQYHIHFRMSYLEKVKALDKVLDEQLWYRCEQVLTLAEDGTMDGSGVASWVASNATLTKDTTFANVLPGRKQALKLVTTSANGYGGHGNAIRVKERDVYRVAVWVRPASAANICKIVARDNTAGADIALSGTASTNGADGNDWVLLDVTFAIPEGCTSMGVRLQDETTLSTSYWNDLAIIPPRLIFPTPAWINSRNDIEWFWRQPALGFGQGLPEPVDNWEVVVNPTQPLGTTLGNVWVQFGEDARGRILTVTGRRFYGSLGADTATLPDGPARWARAALRVELLDRLCDGLDQTEMGSLQIKLAKHQQKLAAVMADELPEYGYTPPRRNLRTESVWVG